MRHDAVHFLLLYCLVAMTSCSEDRSKGQVQASDESGRQAGIIDRHSHARPSEASITHLDLELDVDMDARTIRGKATYEVKAEDAREVVLDTDGLLIDGVVDGAGRSLEYSLGDSSFLGRPLRISLAGGARRISITYRTGPGAKALQWLEPRQTADKRHPFLYTQGQAILTRSWIPVQDSPAVRFTYSATVKVPQGLMAVMSATNAQQRATDGRYRFEMRQQIPAYLIALAVGDIVFKPIDERTGVYAEPSVVDRAAWEFAEVGAMLATAERLVGPYRWGRYDLIVLPPSFPFGGMENPCLTFATPTILAGDRSLTSLVAHELAHSWSGNLVTNATWNDFWLNEGFTVYIEGRIAEAILGPDHAIMMQQLGRQDLLGTLDEIARGRHPEDGRLRLDLSGRDPDEGMTDVAYEKGAAFLRLVESKVGRPRFDAFMRAYFDRFAFRAMTTDGFLAFLNDSLLAPARLTLDVAAWMDGAGLPADAPFAASERFTRVEGEVQRWAEGTPAANLATKGWSTFEWVHFLRHLPSSMNDDQMRELDQAFGFTKSGNSEVLAAWLEQGIRHDFDPIYGRLDEFLTTVGRRKYLLPLYSELLATEKGRSIARSIYDHARANYHSVSVGSIDALLDRKEKHPPVSF